MSLPETNDDEGQIPLYTSVLYVQNCSLGTLGFSVSYDFHWFLSNKHHGKKLLVVLTPFLGYSQKPEIVLDLIFDVGLKQKFNPCAYCKKAVPSAAHCCDNTWYCDKACQKDHWPVHKAVCTRSARPASSKVLVMNSSSLSQAALSRSSGPASSDVSVMNSSSLSQAALSNGPALSEISVTGSADSAPHATVSLSSVESAISRLELLSSSVAEVCTVCAAPGSLKTCKCGKLYCSKTCQNFDWSTHKKVCKKPSLGLQASKICSKCKRPADGSVCVKCALK